MRFDSFMDNLWGIASWVLLLVFAAIVAHTFITEPSTLVQAIVWLTGPVFLIAVLSLPVYLVRFLRNR